MRKIIRLFIYILDCIIPKSTKQLSFVSFPDLSDNSFAMFKYIYLYQKEKCPNIVWLLNDINKIPQYKEMLIDNLNLSKTSCNNIVFAKKNSIKGLWFYFRSKYVFFTHGLYPRVKYSKKHILINLWHGMPLKAIGFLMDPSIKDVPTSSFLIATSSFFQKFMAQAFKQNLEQVIINGQPRNDLLFENTNCLLKFGIQSSQYNKLFLWTPTYRQSNIGNMLAEGNIFDGLPLISEDYVDLNNYLIKLKSYMIVKLHPMDVLNNVDFESYTNLLFIKNSDLEKHHCQINQILGEIDVLLTDFSSIYIDFLILDRPIAFAIDDFMEYSSSRGFIFENPRKYMPGEFLNSKTQLFTFLNNCVHGQDRFQDERNKVNGLFNEGIGEYSHELWKKISVRK